MLTITDDDIQFAEKWLLPEGAVFNKQRRRVVENLQSIDVLACPGSGKTTALIAKLIIISRKLPLIGGKGICVLTHTNVAIDTITQRIGLSANRLFNFPNHFGTIQSFVDKYLAIPCYIEMFGHRPFKIDNDWYKAKLERQRKYLGRKAQYFCHKNPHKDYPNSICFNDFDTTSDGKCGSLNLDLRVSDHNEIYNKLLACKKSVLQSGILSYDDAYYLATSYLEKHPVLRSLFLERFAYVFIDEMQDTDARQLALIDSLFNDSVVIQRIGDINQSIFDSMADDVCCWHVRDKGLLEITGSKRFSNAIANVIQSICIKPQKIEGNSEIIDIKPTIIAFADGNIQNVIPRFADLIIEHDLHKVEGQCFKVVGWVGKPNIDRHTISSYWTAYEKEIQIRNVEYTGLVSYLRAESDEFIRSNGVRYYRRALMRAFLKCLRIVDKPNGKQLRTEAEFYKYIEEDKSFYAEFQKRMAEWCLAIHAGNNLTDEIKIFIGTEFKAFFGIDNMDVLDSFLNSGIMETGQSISIPAKTNIYNHIRDGNQICIEIATIHSVKGQTHTATLYLETFLYEYDVKRIIEYVKGKHRTPTQPRVCSNLRVSYVGMSRASHLLCVAVHSAHLVGHLKELGEAGWTIDSTLS